MISGPADRRRGTGTLRAAAGAIVLLTALLALRPVDAFAADVPISLDEAVRSAIERNLDLRVETYNPAIAQAGVRRATAIYNAKLSVSAGHAEESAKNGPLSDFVLRTRSDDFNASVSRLFSTGAAATAAFTNAGSSDNLGAASSRLWKPEMSLTLSQPVLSGFGQEVTARGITTASDAKESALAGWRNRAIGIAADARNQYFALINARENLETRKASLALAQRVHAENQARVKAGILAEIELLDSELGVAQREKDLLDADKNVLDQADRLRVIVQYPAGASLSPSESFPEGPSAVPEEDATAAALRARPDLAAARISLRTSEFQARVSRNLALPSVALSGTAGVSGLGREYGTAVDDAASGKYPFWSVGIAFAYPLGNDAAEADLAAARLQARRAQASIRTLEESIGLDVRAAVRNLASKHQQIAVAQKGVELAEARLASYLKRQKLGLATTKDVLQVETDLVTSRVGLASARADYQNAVTQLHKSTGELLDRHGIAIDDAAVLNSAWKELP